MYPALLPYKRLWAHQGASVRSRGEKAVYRSVKTPPFGKARLRRAGHTAHTAFRGQRHNADGPPRPARNPCGDLFPRRPQISGRSDGYGKGLRQALRSPESSMSARTAFTHGEIFRENFHMALPCGEICAIILGDHIQGLPRQTRRMTARHDQESGERS